jgi:FixJ family two-component response regulator
MFLSAEAFLQSPRLNDTACLISDVHMPNVSGIELQRMLLDRGVKIPTVFMTAFSNEKIKAKALAAGAVCFLMKPLDTDTLIKCIYTALEQNVDEGGASSRC